MSGLFYSEVIAKVYADTVLLLDAYRRENEVLRMMLLERGLTRPMIRREVKKRVKYFRQWEEASALFQRVLQETQTLLHETDPVTKIVESLGKTKKRDAN